MTRWKLVGLIFAVAALAVWFLVIFRGGGQAPAPKGPEFTLAASKAYNVENPHAGTLYVIEGTATNNMDSARCRIQIKASLLDAGGKELAQEEALAGPVASISELKFLGWDELRGKLVPNGDDPCRATSVSPGASVPFMAVFRRPPAGAATYSVSATGSTSGAVSKAPGANPK